MNQQKLLDLVEKLRRAGQSGMSRARKLHPCACHKCKQDMARDLAVDTAARVLVAEIERMQSETFREQQRAEEDNLLNDLRTGSKT